MEIDISENFYRKYAQRYAEVSQQRLQSIYLDSSHTAFRDDQDKMDFLPQVIPGPRGLDTGFGAAARDMAYFQSRELDVYGIDAIKENVEVASMLNPDLRGRLLIANLKHAIPFDDRVFDFVVNNAVIQHIDAETVTQHVLLEFHRVLRPGGVLLLAFKRGNGVLTVYDPHFETHRTFQLFDEQELLSRLVDIGFEPIEIVDDHDMIHYVDGKGAELCILYLRKVPQ